MSPFMKSPYQYFIVFIVCLCPLSTNSSTLIKVPLPVFKNSLEKTMDVVLNVASTMSHMHVEKHDGRNANIAIPYCADLLGSTAQVLNWSLSTIHDLKGALRNLSNNNAQFTTRNDVISHMGAWSNTSLSRHKTCMEAFEGTNSILAGSLKQVTTSIHSLLGMLHAHQTADFVFSIRTSKHISPWLQRPNFIVSHDGSGDFKLISDAIAAAPDHSRQYFVIFVKRGVYYEYVNIGAKKSNLVLVGEGMDNTFISGNRSNGTGWDTSDSATFTVEADGFIAVNIGFVNTAGPYNMQAVALRSQGDRSAFFRCSISGYQDTLLVHDGRQFFRMCKISGTVDFIFGYGTAVFQKCTIISKQNRKGGRNEITAHGRFNQNDPTGFSFQFCNIVYDNSHGTVSVENQTPTYLGRPWGNCSRTVFMQSQLDAVIRPEGWHEWSGDFGLKTLYYGEYMNEGPGSNLLRRVKWPGYHVITDPAVAVEFTVAKFTGGNSWLPSTGIPYAPGLLKDR